MVKVQSSFAKRLICRVGSTTIPSGYASLGVAASSARSQRHCRVIDACRLYASKSGRQTRQPVCRLRAQRQTSPNSFDHLVGELLEMYGDVEAQSLGSFEIDCQFKGRRTLYRQIGRFLALEDAVDISRGTPIYACTVGSIGN